MLEDHLCRQFVSFFVFLYTNLGKNMATIIKLPRQKKNKSALYKEIKKYSKPSRNPEKAIDGLYGLWEGQDISIKKIRTAKRRKKW